MMETVAPEDLSRLLDGVSPAIPGPIQHLPGSEPTAALTFDDGPDPLFSRRMLDVLLAHNVRATFFVLGKQAERHGEVVEELRDAGMGLGVHSWGHPDIRVCDQGVVQAELVRTVELLRSLGVTPTVFRPPYGTWDTDLVHAAAGLGLRTILWSIDSRDWEEPSARVLAKRVEAALLPGAIVLMHDGGGDRTATVAALPRIIQRAADAGLAWVELAGALARAQPVAPVDRPERSGRRSGGVPRAERGPADMW